MLYAASDHVITVSVISTVGVILAAIITATASRQKKKLEEIHVLVNSRLTEALEEITALKEALVQSEKETETAEESAES
jgi:hypothetical protein